MIAATRRTILTLNAAARVVDVIEDRAAARPTYYVQTRSLFSQTSTIVGPITGQHLAIAQARLQVAA